MRGKCQKCKAECELVDMYSSGRCYKLCSFCYNIVKDKYPVLSVESFLKRGNGLNLGKETYNALHARILKNTGKRKNWHEIVPMD